MKIRTDFVTNSSSSSFIIAFKTDGTKLSEVLLSTLCDASWEDTSEGDLIKTKEELDKYFLEDCYGEEGDDLEKLLNEYEKREEYDECLEALNDGYTIMTKWVGYDADIFKQIIYNLSKKLNKQIFVLRDDD